MKLEIRLKPPKNSKTRTIPTTGTGRNPFSPKAFARSKQHGHSLRCADLVLDTTVISRNSGTVYNLTRNRPKRTFAPYKLL